MGASAHTYSRVMRSAHNQIAIERSSSGRGSNRFLLESLILAQDERWRRA